MKKLFIYFFLVVCCIPIFGQTHWAKDTLNPVLPRGANGDWDDALVAGPYVIFDGTTYHMWYAGYDGSTGTNIGYATSPDGVDWTKYDDPTTISPPYANSDPVLTTGSSGSWDEVANYQPSVFFDGTTYHLWFGGHEGTNRQIGYATSPDGITWTKYSGNPILTPGPSGSWDDVWVDSPNVLFMDGTFHMWYSGNNGTITQSGHATSPDGITWEKDTLNPVLKVESGEWDDIMCYQPSVIFDGYTYHMWYSGGGAFLWRIGYAYSFDGEHWTKENSQNPVLEPGTLGSWDETYVGGCGVILFSNTTAKMWYTGGTGFVTGDIGYATEQNFVISVEDNISEELPVEFSLSQNYPNPFNPTTKIKYFIPQSSNVLIKVFDILGNEVETLVDEEKPVGTYELTWYAENLPSGVYFYQLQAGSFIETKKLALLK